MQTTINMPKLGLQMTVGVITEWLVKEGDRVEKGQPVFRVETDKITSDVEATVSGRIVKITVQEGEEAKVAEPCCYVDDDQDAVFPSKKKRALISPAARKLAEELKIDVDLLRGSGPAGRIQKSDILAEYEKKKEVRGEENPPEDMKKEVRGEENPPEEMRKEVRGEENLPEEQKKEKKENEQPDTQNHIPGISYVMDVDGTSLTDTLEKLNKSEQCGKEDGRISRLDLILMAAVKALDRCGEMNTYVCNDAMSDNASFLFSKLHLNQERDITKRGLTVLSLDHTEFTSFSADLTSSETGVLTAGPVREKAVVVDHKLVIKPVFRLIGTFDRSKVKQDTAERFMVSTKTYLENVMLMFL